MDDGLIKIAEAKDRERILSLLRKGSARNAHVIEDLIRWPRRSKFYFVEHEETLSFLHVSGHPGHKEPVLILDGDPETVAALLKYAKPQAPFVVRETSTSFIDVVKDYYPDAKIFRAHRMNVYKDTYREAHRGLARQLRNDEDDLRALEGFFRDSKKGPFELPMWLKGVRAFHGVFEENRLLALGSSMISLPEVWNLISIETHPEHRGRGLATEVTSSLVARALEETDTVTLSVLHGNDPAIKVYKKLGFESTQECMWADCGADSSP